MTNKAIYDNLKRLLIFLDSYKEEEVSKFNNDNIISPITLFQEYYRYLDIHGCEKSGVSYIFLNNNDYNEFIEDLGAHYPSIKYIKKQPERFCFFLDYHWVIVNKDVKAVLYTIVTVKDSVIEDGKTKIYLSEEDHFNKGSESPVKNIRKITVESTRITYNVSEFNSDEINKHFIVINKELHLKSGEILIINETAFYTNIDDIKNKKLK